LAATRVAVDLPAQDVDHGRQVLAGNGPVRARTLHRQVAPTRGEDGNLQAARFLQHCGIETSIEQPPDQAGVGGQALGQPCRIGGGYRGDRDLHGIGPRPGALDLRPHPASFDHELQDGALIGVGASRGSRFSWSIWVNACNHCAPHQVWP
jgi:hypothetical protein